MMKHTALLLFFLLQTLHAEQRIVSLAPSIDEILFGLGKGERVVGNTTFSTYPKEAANKPKVGGYFAVSLEKVLMLKPSLVLMQKNNLPIKAKLEKLGIKTVHIEIDSLQSIKEGMRKIAGLVDAKARAEVMVSKIEEALESCKGIVTDKKILIVFGREFDLKKEIFISGNRLYFADIIRASGNHNAYTEISNAQPMLSYEGIVALNPDIVYILAHTIADEKKAALIAPWLDIPIHAAKSKTIYVNTHKYAGMPSHRVVHFIEDFQEVLEDARRKLY